MSDEQNLPDVLLVRRAARGDEWAASRLYHRYADKVHAICYRVVLDAHTARDCSQETWFKIFKELDRYQENRSFQTWISTIAIRTAIDEYRKTARRRHTALSGEFSEQIPGDNPCARLEAEDAEVQHLIERALATLSDTQRAAFVLRHFEGVDITGVSEALGCHPGTAKTHIHRAITALRKSLSALKEKLPYV